MVIFGYICSVLSIVGLGMVAYERKMDLSTFISGTMVLILALNAAELI
jgi:hypothetical protein